MSKGTLGQVVKRAISDAAFRRQLQADPSGALKGFDLSDEERSALRSGDASKLSALGIDQRMSKAFTLGDATAGASKAVSSNDLTAEANISDARITGGGARSADEARLVTNPKSADSALISDGNAGTRTGATESGGAYRSPIRDADNQGGAQTAREFDPAAGNAARESDPAGGAAARSSVRDPDNQGGATGSGAERSWSGDQHGVREAVSGSNQTQGTAFLSADETGRNVTAGEGAVAGTGARGGDAFMTSDEMGRDVTEGGGNVASQYPDAASERAAIEASQQGDDAQATNPWAENAEHHG